MNGVEQIAAERKRQIEVLGYDLHFDSRRNGTAQPDWLVAYARFRYLASPTREVQDLVKAGALIAAEIDRLEGTNDL